MWNDGVVLFNFECFQLFYAAQHGWTENEIHINPISGVLP